MQCTQCCRRARYITADFFEYLDSMDYDKYFDTMSAKKTISGAQNAQFVDFSSKALKAAQQRLATFIALCPADQVAMARQQIDAVYSM